MQTKTFNNAPTFTMLQELAVIVQTGTAVECVAKAESMLAHPLFVGVHWQRDMAKLVSVFTDSRPRFSIFAKRGNKKLPFVAFSTLPGVTCPGAGECLQYCYSFRAWRYPAAFATQVQNAFLMRFSMPTIAAEFALLSQAKKFTDGFDFRLYVDGDFSSQADLEFWMALIEATPKVRAYGYSKSFGLFLEYDRLNTFPKNYMVNLSSGHNSDAVTAALFSALPVVRGSFKAVAVAGLGKHIDHASKEHQKTLRAAYKSKAFTCPGDCGNCTPTGHACGSEKFRNVDIIIAVH